MWRWIGLAVFVLLLLVATLPLRLALGWVGAGTVLSASRVEGTVWHGTLRDTQAQGISLGDVALALDIPSLLTGRPVLHIAASGADVRGVLRRAADGTWRLDRRAP